MTERKVYRPEEKMKIVMEGLRGTIQISELCRKYSIKPARFYSWKEKLMKNSTVIFDDRGRKEIPANKRIGDMQTEITRLKDTIAEIASENLELKKKLGSYGVKR
jgi:transposase-like protein